MQLIQLLDLPEHQEPIVFTVGPEFGEIVAYEKNHFNSIFVNTVFLPGRTKESAAEAALSCMGVEVFRHLVKRKAKVVDTG